LIVTLVGPKAPLRADEAYAACRAAIRKARPEAARIPFPTGDLIRVTRSDSVHHTVRGYYVVAGGARQTRYDCQLTALAGSAGWTIDTIVFRP
jgi:hypothetical protein